MRTPDTKFLDKWERTRRDGQLRFVVVYGMLMWGRPLFAFMVTLDWQRFLQESLAKQIAAAAIWLLGGAGFGGILWWLNELRYRQQRALQDLERK